MTCVIGSIQGVRPLNRCTVAATALCRVIHAVAMVILCKPLSLICSRFDTYYDYYHQKSEATINYYWAYGEQVQTFSVNKQHPSLGSPSEKEINAIKGKFKTTLYPLKEENLITYNPHLGVCYGIVHDFLIRVLEHQKKGLSTEEAAKKAGSHFADGATSRAALIQKIYCSISMDVFTAETNLKHMTAHDQTLLNHFGLKKTHEKSMRGDNFKDELISLPVGAYHMSLCENKKGTSHSMGLVKSEKGHYFLMEPNGALLFADHNSLETLVRHLQHTGYQFTYFFKMSS